jgi:hypothetical protein
MRFCAIPQTKTPPQLRWRYSWVGLLPWSVPDPQQRIQLSVAYQPLRVAAVKQTSWVGRPDPFASMVFQPLRHNPERLVIDCRWAQSRLTCCVHVHTYSLARERLIYVLIVTERCARSAWVNP